VNSWLHHHTVVAAVVAHGLAVTGVKVDAEHLPWLASHPDPQLPHSIPTFKSLPTRVHRAMGGVQHQQPQPPRFGDGPEDHNLLPWTWVLPYNRENPQFL